MGNFHVYTQYMYDILLRYDIDILYIEITVIRECGLD